MKKTLQHTIFFAGLILLNIGLLVFCFIQFSADNYLYYSTSAEKSWEIHGACTFLFRAHYFWLANTLNILVFGMYWAVVQPWKSGALLSAFGLLFGLACYWIIKPALVENYYTLFLHQSVPDELVSQPARQAGRDIGVYLKKDLAGANEIRQKKAIRALSAIQYEAVTDTLNSILCDWNVPDDIRFECFVALKQMGNAKAESHVRVFLAAHHPVRDRPLMDYISRFDN